MTDFYIGKMQVSPSRNLLISGSKRVSVEPKVMDVLVEFSERNGEVLSRDHLISTVWQIEFGGDESLTRVISILRKTLSGIKGHQARIQTIRKRGYRFVGDVRPADNERPKPVEVEPIASSSVVASMTTQSPAHINAPANASGMSTAPSAGSRSNSNLVFGIGLALMALALVGFGWQVGKHAGENTLQASGQQGPGVSASQGSQENENSRNVQGAGSQQNSGFGNSNFGSSVPAMSEAELALAMMFAFDDGNIDKVAALSSADWYIRQAVVKAPNASLTQTAQGWLNYHQLDTDEAMLLFEKATVNDPVQTRAWLGRARVLLDRGDLDLALISAEQAMRIDPLFFHARMLRAEILMSKGDLVAAARELQDILNLASQNKKAQELSKRLDLFRVYDRNRDLLVSKGEISKADGMLHDVLDLDAEPGLSIREFRSEGRRPWMAGTLSGFEPDNRGSLRFVSFDLSDTAAPKIVPSPEQ